MRFIVNRYYSMIGYRDLRYGLCNTYTGNPCFFNRTQYDVIQTCDGKHDIDVEQWDPEHKAFFQDLLKHYFIRPCTGEESLTPMQEYRLYPNNYKDSVHWSLTGLCNCRCRHCFVSAPHAIYPQLSLDECLTILDQFESCGIKKIGLTGGEPLCHPHFKAIVREIKKRNLVLSTLYTNAILLNEDIVQLLKDTIQSPNIQISFDGIHTHDWLRGVEGAGEAAVSAIKLCSNNNLHCHISMVLFKDNLNDLAENIRFLDSLGVRSIKVSIIENLGEWRIHNEQHGISREDAYEAFMQYIPQCLKERPKADIILGGFFKYSFEKGSVPSPFEKACKPETESQYLLCGSLKDALYVNSDGRVFPCISMMEDDSPYNQFNILNTPLEDILNDHRFSGIGDKTAADYLKQNTECATCSYRYQCLGGCRAKAMLAGNGEMGMDPEVCAYFKDGWKERKDSLLAHLTPLS